MNNKPNLVNKARKLISLISCALLALGAAADNDPKAKPEAIVQSGNARFTVLTPEMIRIEYSDKGDFEDRATFAVVNRNLEVPKFEKTDDGEYLSINTDKLKLKYRKGSGIGSDSLLAGNLTISMKHNGQDVIWHPGQVDPLNLKGTCRTLDRSNGDNKRSELENGLISRSGWAVIDDSWSTKRADGSRSFAFEPNAEMGFDWWADRKDPQALDLYFFGYGNDYKKALADFTKVAGKIPLPPAYVFGYWYSKYSAYSSDDYRQIMAALKDNDIRCDVMILDMDWHWNGKDDVSGGRGGWTGWTWNTNLIPDAKGLLKDIHDQNLKIALNLHPADGVSVSESPGYFAAMQADLNGKYGSSDTIPWMLDYPDFAKSFFSRIIRDHESEGVDFWWLDWQQHCTSRYTKGLGQTFWCNHVFFNEMAKSRTARRPVIFHRWGGLGSHRYQIGFSGDAKINFPTLNFQPYFTATASNVGYGYWGHDLGGHAFTDKETVNDPELVLRWIQFGVFTPIFRTHATNHKLIERRIWKFPNFPTMNEAVKLRYALFPYIYTMAREAYDTGISICRPLYYEYPDQEEAYAYENEYFFGRDILVAPVTEASKDGISTKEIWFPEGKWWSVATNELIEGPCVKTMDFRQDQIPYFFRQGAMIPYNTAEVRNVTAKPDHLIVNAVAGHSGVSSLYEDDGDNPDYAFNYAVTEMRVLASKGKDEFVIGPRSVVSDGNNAPDLVSSRAYTFNIHNVNKPKSVSLSGKKLSEEDFKYNADTRTLQLSIPKTDCTSEIRIEVKHK